MFRHEVSVSEDLSLIKLASPKLQSAPLTLLDYLNVFMSCCFILPLHYISEGNITNWITLEVQYERTGHMLSKYSKQTGGRVSPD